MRTGRKKGARPSDIQQSLSPFLGLGLIFTTGNLEERFFAVVVNEKAKSIFGAIRSLILRVFVDNYVSRFDCA